MNNNGVQPGAVTFLRARYVGRHEYAPEVEANQIAHQRDVCKQKASDLGADVVREYIEHGGTGSIEKRPILRLMLDELLALHDARYVIVAGGDRLARNLSDWRAIALELEAAGAELILASDLNDNVNTASALASQR